MLGSPTIRNYRITQLPRNARKVVVSKMEVGVSESARISLHPISDGLHLVEANCIGLQLLASIVIRTESVNSVTRIF